MKAFILDGYGSADRVQAGDAADPEPRENDVLVRIHAAGVNLLDSKIRTGEFKLILRYRLPLILGHDVAGIVRRVGFIELRSNLSTCRRPDEVLCAACDGLPELVHSRQFIAIKEDDVGDQAQGTQHGRGGLHPFGWIRPPGKP